MLCFTLIHFYELEFRIPYKQFVNKMSDNNIENMDTDSQPPVDCDSWCRIRDSAEAKYKFVFTIESFSQRPEKCGECLDSDIFTIHGPGNMKTQWKIQLYPKGDPNGVQKGWEREISDWLVVYLCNETEAEVKAGYEFSILDSDKTKKRSNKASKKLPSKTSSKIGKSLGGVGLIKFKDLQSLSSPLLPNDSLTVVCDVTIFGPEETVT